MITLSLNALTIWFSGTLHCMDLGSPSARGSFVFPCCLLCSALGCETRSKANRAPFKMRSVAHMISLSCAFRPWRLVTYADSERNLRSLETDWSAMEDISKISSKKPRPSQQGPN